MEELLALANDRRPVCRGNRSRKRRVSRQLPAGPCPPGADQRCSHLEEVSAHDDLGRARRGLHGHPGSDDGLRAATSCDSRGSTCPSCSAPRSPTALAPGPWATPPHFLSDCSSRAPTTRLRRARRGQLVARRSLRGGPRPLRRDGLGQRPPSAGPSANGHGVRAADQPPSRAARLYDPELRGDDPDSHPGRHVIYGAIVGAFRRLSG